VDVTAMSPRQISELGVAHVPEDREKHGVVGEYPIYDNLVLNRYFKAPFVKRGVRQMGAVRAEAERLIEMFDVRTPSMDTLTSSLSGGNRQKTIIARELSQDPNLMLVAQPTRGLDVGSIQFIHEQIIALRDSGVAVLLVSAELDEIMSLSDRVGVMYQGKMVGVVEAEGVTRETLGILMAGGTVQDGDEQDRAEAGRTEGETNE
jgi:simple sugar transport system ATP-binding protein